MANSSPPVATADTAKTAENAAVSINVLANDSSPNGPLTLTGVTQGAHGTVATALVTNSAASILSGQEINAGAVLAYDRSQPFTVMAQLDVAQNPSQAAIIASNLVGSGSAHPGYQIFIDPAGHLQVRLVSNYSTGNDIDVQSSFVVTNGNWHDIAVSYDGSGSASGIKIYEDGKQDTATTVIANSLTGSIVSSTPAPLIIGNQAGWPYALNGLLEQFSISDVARSAAYIAQYSSLESVAPVDANTALDYNFSQNTGTIVHDLSSNGYNGTLSSSAMWTSGPSVPEVTYTPQTGFVGTDTFSYTESNGTGTATGQVTVTVNPAVNSSPPVATADTAKTAENAAVSINVLANDSSPNGPLTLTGVTQGAHGTVATALVTNSAASILSGQEINAGAVLAYDRSQPFTVMAQLDVAQNPSQAAIIASNLVGSGSAHPGYQIFIDPAGHLQVRLVSNYSTGNDIDVQSSFVVTNGNWHDIAVSYDGSGSASGIKIYEDGKQDTATTVIANSLTGSIVSSTPAPLIIGNQAGWPYALNGLLEQFSISDVARSAAYIAQYSSLESVAPVDANTALDYNFSQNTGTIVHDLSSNGYNGTLSSSAMWTSGPSVPEVTYTPQTGFVGTDTFSYTESNGTGTATGQVTVTVNPAVNSSPPVATADTAKTAENAAVSINVLANDSSPNGPLTLTGVTQGAHGTVATALVTNSAASILSGQEINAGAVLAYDRSQPFTVMAQLDVAQNPSQAAIIASNLVGSGSAHPGYQIFIDPAGHLQVRLVSNYSTGNDIDVQSSFVVTNGNWHDIAVSYDGSGSASGIKIYEDGKQDTATTVIANSLTGSIVSSTPAPLIIGNQAGWPYALNGLLEQFSISDVARSAAYIAQYSSLESVAPVDANTALDYNFSQNTGTIVHDLSSNGYNGTLSSSAMWTSGPSVPEVTYTPQTGFVGTDTFSYTESNGTGTATGQVTVTVNPAVNSSPPVATADTAQTAENTAVSINVLANDSSPNGPLTLTGVTQGAHGTVAIAQVTNSAASITSGQEINAGAVLAYDRSQPFTVMAQLDVAKNPNAFGGTAEDAAVIFTNVNASPYPGYELWIDSTGHLRVRIISNFSTGNYIDVESSIVVTDGKWHDVAYSYDGSSSASGVKIYVDGHQDTHTTTLVNSLTGSIVGPTHGPLIIGNQTNWPYALDGLLEQFSISDVARSAAYIAQYSSLESVAPVDANTAVDYNFDQSTGSTIVYDLSSNGYNGTLSSSAMWTSGPSVPEVTYTPQTGFAGTDAFSYTESNGTGTATGQVTVDVGSGTASSLASPTFDTTVHALTEGPASDTGPLKAAANATPTESADPNPIVTTLNGPQIDATAPVAMSERAHVALGASIEVTHAEASTSGVLANSMDSAPSYTPSVTAVQGQAGNVGHAVEGTYGSLTLNADGSFTYTNTNTAAVTAAGGVVQDVFNYLAGNGHGGTATSALTFVITSPGDTYVGGASGVTLQGGTGSYVLDGGAGHDTVVAGTGTQVLIGGPGDTFMAGKGADTFVFAADFGNETINNFNPAHDVIALPRAETASLAAVLADTHLAGQNTVIALNANDMITLDHVSPQSLHASDFHLV